MQKTSPYYKSFSFRTGLLIFVVLCATLVTLRLLVYYQTINESYRTIRMVIDAHADEINHDMNEVGARFVLDTIDAVLDDVQDSNLYIGFSTDKELAGNLPEWSVIQKIKISEYRKPQFYEVYIPRPNMSPLHLYVETIDYPGKERLIVGYNLQSLDYMRQGFYKILVENIFLALLISLALSLMIMWVMNRHFRRLNDACARVISGDMSFRIASAGQRDQFEKLAWNINQMLDWNKALISTVQDSTNAIAHDMRTPLSRLRLKLRAISDDVDEDSSVRDGLVESISTVDRLVEMFENILKIARAESRISTDLFEVINLASICKDIIEFYQIAYEEKNIHLSAFYSSDCIEMKGDKQLMSQAILNLLDNACKYTPEGGTIVISLEETLGQILFSISDSGPGIPQEVLSKAAERFFRAEPSRHEAGYGLGLSLVQAVATLHRGVLELYNLEPGLKAVLRFTKS